MFELKLITNQRFNVLTSVVFVLCFCLIDVYSQKKADLPELILQTGHAQSVQSVAYGPDSKWVATASYDGTIKIWNVEEGRELRALSGHTGAVKALVISADGQRLASVGTDQTIRIWKVSSGEEIGKITSGEHVDSVAFGPNNERIAWGRSDGLVVSRDLQSGTEIQHKGMTASVTALAFGPNGSLLAAGASTGEVRLWELASGMSSKKLSGHKDRIRTIRFENSGGRFATAGDDLDIRVWDTERKRQLHQLKSTGGAVLGLRFASGNKLLSADVNRNISEWSLSEKPRLNASRKAAAAVADEDAQSADFSNDGTYLSLGFGSGVATVSDVITGRTQKILQNNVSGNYSVAVSPNNRWLAVGSFDSTVKLWDLKSGGSLPPLRGRHSGRVVSVKFHPNSEFLYSASLDSSISIWKTEAGTFEGTLSGHTGPISAMDISPSGNLLASAGLDETVRIWSLKDRALTRTLKGHSGEVTSVAFSQDEKYVSSVGRDGQIKIWNAISGHVPIKTIDPKVGPLRAVKFSADGKRVFAGTEDGLVRIWDLASAKEVVFPEGHSGPINSLTVGVDGSIITAGQDGSIIISDGKDGTRKNVLKGHSGPVFSVAQSSDASWLFSCSEDGTVALWNGRTTALAARLISLRERSDWLVATPSGFFDGSTAAWDQLAWRFENETFSFRTVEVFFNEFFSPGILARLIEGKGLPSSAVITTKDRRQPRVVLSIANDTPTNDITERSARVKITITDATAGAKDLRLFRNGTLVNVWRGDVMRGRTTAEIEFSLPIVAGNNELSAYAFNVDNIKSQDAKYSVIGSAKLFRKGDLHIVSVGVNDYASPDIRDLRYAVPDADAFAAELRRQQTIVGRFDKIEVHQLLNDKATRNEILRLLAKVGENLEPEDALVFYYAGHGIAVSDRFFFIPQDFKPGEDFDPTSGRFPSDEGISDLQIEAALENLGAGSLLMIIDACNSGQALETKETRFGPMNSKGLAQLAYEKGMYILTASQNYQAALEASRLGHGFLTYALVEEGLKTPAADTDPKDGNIVLREWLDFATVRVPDLHFQVTESRQLVHNKAQQPKAPAKMEAQRPRVFYRSEREVTPFTVAKLQQDR